LPEFGLHFDKSGPMKVQFLADFIVELPQHGKEHEC